MKRILVIVVSPSSRHTSAVLERYRTTFGKADPADRRGTNGPAKDVFDRFGRRPNSLTWRAMLWREDERAVLDPLFDEGRALRAEPIGPRAEAEESTSLVVTVYRFERIRPLWRDWRVRN